MSDHHIFFLESVCIPSPPEAEQRKLLVDNPSLQLALKLLIEHTIMFIVESFKFSFDPSFHQLRV